MEDWKIRYAKAFCIPIFPACRQAGTIPTNKFNDLNLRLFLATW